MAEKREELKLAFTTPRGVFIYPKLNTPDTKWKAQGEYTVKNRIPGDADGFLLDNGKTSVNIEELTGKLNELLEQVFEERKAALLASKDGKNKAKAKLLKKRDQFFTPHVDEAGEETGEVIVKAHMIASGENKETKKKWARKPSIFDAKGKKIDKPISGGTEGKVAVEAKGYYAPNDNVVGITFYLDAVQVLKLVQRSERSASAFGFGQEEGYVDDGDADEASGGKFGDGELSSDPEDPGAADEF